MSELWSAQQREWLQAMGHTVLVLADSPSAQAQAAPPEQSAQERATQEPERASERDRPARSASADTRREPAPSRPTRGGDGDALLRNLSRAARRDAGDAEVRALYEQHAVRGDPAAKRALWPHLRALRRAGARG